MSQGWIKLHRKIQDSPMYKQMPSNQRDVLIQLLLMANHAPNDWKFDGKMYHVEAGQFITSLKSIKEKCAKDVSIQTVRSTIFNCQLTGFLTNQSTKTNRLITICKWDEYQSDATEEVTDESLTDQQTANKQLTTNKNDKNEKKGYIAEILKIIKEITGKSYDSIPKKLVDRLYEDYEPEGVGFALRYFAQTDWGKENMGNFGIKYLLDIEKINEWHRKGSDPSAASPENVQWNPDDE